jgi:anti-sigma B factor antagonist
MRRAYRETVMPAIRVTTVHITGGTYVCSVAGALDSASVETMGTELDAAFALGAHDIVLDLMRLTSLDSDGLGLLLRTSDRLRAGAGRLAVACDDPRTLQLLDVTGLDRQFLVERSVADGIEAVGART